MTTALVYILTSITLVVILGLTRSPGHEAANGVDIFKYQPGLLRVLSWCCPVPLILMASVYLVTTPVMSGQSLALLLMAGVIGSSLVYYAYKYLDALHVEIGRSGMRVFTLRGSKNIDFKDVRRVDYIEGGKGVLFIDILDDSDKRVAHLSSTLQDFDDLHRLIKAGAAAYGATYRQRDKWGKWSD